MIRTIGLLAGAMLAIGACSEAQESGFSENCAILMDDPDAKSNIRDMNANAMSFCACMSQLTAAKSSGDQAFIRATLTDLTTRMQETGQGVEAVAAPMMNEAMAQPDSADAQATISGIKKLGRLIDEIEGAFDDGTCTN